jgi:nucleotide-binding universal stress UspA family protein
MNKIIVPVDFSDAAAASLRFAYRLAAATGLSVNAVYVYNSMVVSNLRRTPKEQQEERRVLKAQLTHFIDTQGAKYRDRVPTIAHVVEDNPPNHIKWLSQKSDTALIVMGGVGMDGNGQGDLFGGIARLVAREGGCPVVLIPPHLPPDELNYLFAATAAN